MSPVLDAALDELASVAATGSEAELLALVRLCESVARRVDAISTSAIAGLDDQGAFLTRGYRSAARAHLCDLMGWDYVEARRRASVAADVHTRTTLDGTPLPARLPSAAAAFGAGEIALRHVDVIGRVLSTDAAGRLSPEQWAGVEAQLATDATRLNPSELQTLGTALVALLDQDGAEPDFTPAPVNELRLTRHACGGSIKGRFQDPALYDAIAAVIDAKAAPLTADDDRPAPQRQAEALADICGHVLDHGDLPDTGGRRPVLTVIVRLEDLERRARSAMLEFGGTSTPAALRTLACDAGVIPVVMNGAGQPLDVGRATRTIPDGLRRAVTARDRGCAHPGCDRPPSWSEIHHIHHWEHGGPTRLDNLAMLCRAHHRQIHHTDRHVGSATASRSSCHRSGSTRVEHPGARSSPTS
ncbi:HNH endonuclease signature motif containing protein [Pseudonocardia oceani]|uniref:DUF222 domain-containing protein n=1 Tax=Pseudonocardia oceani TaxID=2792013 RepID=A0ABS6U5T7_9PSEU|nr:HNH endonuclease signature motif containing protein [Pseudonocardia oceani]MBW0122490.1 DUF222 domain-containing protein [Pseudonocardia oceani]MBW0127607.1 DUF222 domain-containing protein [Pseudonocardia oceani]